MRIRKRAVLYGLIAVLLAGCVSRGTILCSLNPDGTWDCEAVGGGGEPPAE